MSEIGDALKSILSQDRKFFRSFQIYYFLYLVRWRWRVCYLVRIFMENNCRFDQKVG